MHGSTQSAASEPTLPPRSATGCAACGHPNRAGAKFCGGCAAPLAAAVTCSACGSSSPSGQRFCDACGHPLGATATSGPPAWRRLPAHLAERILAAQAARDAAASPEGERKTITALFADIKGSVALMQDLDPEEARNIVDPALELMIAAVHEFEGYVDKCTGDGILALFGAPIAHEDHAQRAVFAAIRIQEEVARYGERLRGERRTPVELRIGLNSGEVVLRAIRKDDLQADYTPIGHSTNVAARMEGLATPGRVLVSENTYRLADGYADFRPMGSVSVKGLREPVRAYEVVGVGSLRNRFDRVARHGLARFVGRESELGHLRRALAQARAGRGQVVGVIGEPGIGKSRLFHEFRSDAETDALVLEASAVAHGRSHPYLPLIELLRACFQIVSNDDEDARRQKIADAVIELDPLLEDTVPYLYHLLGVADRTASLQQMDARIRRRRTFDALKRLVLRHSLLRPLVLVFHDLQWIDGETQGFLDVLVESVVSARILLLVNYRPEYEQGWGRKTFYTQLPLEALPRESAAEMLTALVGEAPELGPLKRLIAEKSDGNPFFMEEIVQALLDRGVLARSGTRMTLTSPLAAIEIPTTVQGVLAARIDRLGRPEKQLLQTLAVIGRSFSLDLLERVVADDGDDLHARLAALQAAEFIYEEHAFPEPRYTFKHALTHDVAYGSLLIRRRRELHERIAVAIEALHRSRLEDHYGDLARHYRASGNTAKAVEYLQLAGRQAVERSAHAEAVDQLTTALVLLESLPDGRERTQRELTIQVALGAPLALTKGYAAPEVGAARTRVLELCRQVGETPQLFPALFGLWAFNLVRGDVRTAHDLGRRLLGLAEAVRDPSLLVEAHRALGATLFFRGDFADAMAHLEAGTALYDRQVHAAHAFLYGQDPGVSCLSYGAVVLWHLGRPDEAARMADGALELADSVAHPFTSAFALDMAAAVNQFRGEAHLTLDRAARAVSVSVDQGFPLWSAYGDVLRGWALVQQERSSAPTQHLRDGLAAWRATGAQIVGPYLLGLLADAYGLAGEPATGLALLDEALAMADASGERWWQPELHRLHGVLLLQVRPDQAASAERALHDAIACARAHGARGLELRAATSLARVVAGRAGHADARERLADVCASRDGSAATADLEEARRVLADVSR